LDKVPDVKKKKEGKAEIQKYVRGSAEVDFSKVAEAEDENKVRERLRELGYL